MRLLRGITDPGFNFAVPLKIDGALVFFAAGFEITDDAEEVFLESCAAPVGLTVAIAAFIENQFKIRVCLEMTCG